MRVAFDTNVLAYAEGFDDDERGKRANRVVAGLAGHELVLPTQVCAELVQVVTKKFRQDADKAEMIVRRWQSVCPIHPASSDTTFEAAIALSVQHHLQIFDAIIVAAAAEAGCLILLSEDMGDGFVWRGVTIVNPFAATPHPLLADALRA